MRVVKYRAWDKEHHHMYGNAYPFEHLVYVEMPRYDEEVQRRISLMQEVNGKLFYFIMGSQIDLMQCTGLHDKNGREIYEGDILQRPGVGVPMLVRWNEKNAGFDLTMRDPKDFDAVTIWYTQFCHTDYEVIGNIYENPELKPE